MRTTKGLASTAFCPPLLGRSSEGMPAEKREGQSWAGEREVGTCEPRGGGLEIYSRDRRSLLRSPDPHPRSVDFIEATLLPPALSLSLSVSLSTLPSLGYLSSFLWF